jgi:hypothetical protein
MKTRFSLKPPPRTEYCWESSLLVATPGMVLRARKPSLKGVGMFWTSSGSTLYTPGRSGTSGSVTVTPFISTTVEARVASNRVVSSVTVTVSVYVEKPMAEKRRV